MTDIYRSIAEVRALMAHIKATVDDITALAQVPPPQFGKAIDDLPEWEREFLEQQAKEPRPAWPLERLMLLRDAEEHESGMEHLWRLLDRRHEQLAASRQQVIALSRENAHLRSKLIEAGGSP